MQKTLSFKVSEREEKKIFELLSNLGNSHPNSNEYVKWHIKGSNFNGIMYSSKKFVLQFSSDSVVERVKEILGLKEEDFKPHIGSDEVGKGDYFGPLVVCACFVSKENLNFVNSLGVMDSKKIKDSDILKMVERLKGVVDYEVSVLKPFEYNKLVSKYKNVAIVLAKQHILVIEKLVRKLGDVDIDSVVVDQFSKSKSRLTDEYSLKIPFKQFHGGESDLCVACASVLARYFFLKEFEDMDSKYKFKFPLGATHVISKAKDFVKEYGSDELKNVAKVSFRTTDRVLGR